uniref:Disease resistance protein winged helix domain-containing protein n=1 Tax=Aegilops tauschii subsp. strangulata TaxID=200361 RepID=A0A453Q4B7_AEGTS
MQTHVHALRSLDEEQSWLLFSSKALPSYRISGIQNLDKYEELGRKLTRKCAGLPLALAVLGGYLSKNLNTQAWSDVLLCWPSTKDTQMMRGIIARSYKNLPNHYLRSCVLYLAAFPEDYIISVSALINLWIAEGFIPHTPKHTVEKTARMYVSELAQRSFLQVVPTSIIHECAEEIRIHDIIRDWCIEEATQDGFLDVIHEKTTSGHGELPSPHLFYLYTVSQIY